MQKRHHIHGFLLTMLFCGLLSPLYAQIQGTGQEATQGQADSSGQQLPDSFIGVDSSIAHLDVRYYHLSDIFPYLEHAGEVDTGITGEQRRESLLRSRSIYQTLSVIGQAHKSLDFSPSPTLGFRYRALPYPCYRRSLENWNLCQVDGIYTMLRYEWRNGRENSFDVEHAQKVGDFSYNLAFQTRLAEGIYVNEGVRDINFGFQGRHRADTLRYGYELYFIYNLFHLHENGGILNDADYFSNLDARAIAVNSSNAQNRSSDSRIGYRHWLRIGAEKDSNGNFLPSHLGYVMHQIDFKTGRSLFTETGFNTSRYTPYFDVADTHDSTSVKEICNQVGWTNIEPCRFSDTVFSLFAGFSHQYVRVGDTLRDFRSQVCALNAFMNLPLKKIGSWSNRLHYAFSGYNANDLDLQTVCTFPFFRKTGDSIRSRTGAFRAGLHYSLYEPDYFYHHYVSNYFCWNQELKKQQLLQVDASCSFRHQEIAFHSYTLGHYTFLTEACEVRQLHEAVQVLQGELYFPLRCGNFGLDLHAYGQFSSSDSLHLPVLVTRNTLFYGFPLFHEAAFLQFGAEMTYFTEYYADGYQASLQQFYSQNSTLIGNDVYLSAFVNARIEHFHIYFACSNILSVLEGHYPFQFPHYPAKGLNFRFGISWRFYD